MRKFLVSFYDLVKQCTHLYLNRNTLPLHIKHDVFKTLVRYTFADQTRPVEATIGKYKLKYPNAHYLLFLLKEIMVYEEYYIRFQTSQPFILDCGANLGMSVLYFKLMFPGARIVAIEANPATYHYLKENTKQMADVEVYNAFASNADKEEEIEFFYYAAGDVVASHDRHRNKSSLSAMVKTLSLAKIIGDQKVDALKMDIEGGEKLIFNTNADLSFLNNVDQIMLEYHHLLADDHTLLDNFSEFLAVFEKHGYTYNIRSAISEWFFPHSHDIMLKMKKTRFNSPAVSNAGHSTAYNA